MAAAEPQWIEQVEVSIRDLRSRLLVTSGTALDVAGVATAAPAADGTATVAGPELAAGDSVLVHARTRPIPRSAC